MKLNDAQRGPAAMISTELSEFLSDPPTGAFYVEQNGQLIVLPTQVLSASDGTWDVSLSGCGDLVLNNSPACLVADSFTTYSAIRGVIVQGTVTNTSRVGTEDKTVVAVRSSRVRTFSFAFVSD